MPNCHYNMGTPTPPCDHCGTNHRWGDGKPVIRQITLCGWMPGKTDYFSHNPADVNCASCLETLWQWSWCGVGMAHNRSEDSYLAFMDEEKKPAWYDDDYLQEPFTFDLAAFLTGH